MTLGISTAMAHEVTSEIGISANPGDEEPKICVYHRDIVIGYEADPVGINIFDYRTSNYMFAGEQLEFTVVVRDPNGVTDIGFARLKNIVTNNSVICTPTTLPASCDGLGAKNTLTDKAFVCLLTAQPEVDLTPPTNNPAMDDKDEMGWYGPEQVKIVVENSGGVETSATHVEIWWFNPALALSVTTSDDQAIHFEDMDTQTRYAHSENNLEIQNLAEGGVNMWMFLAGTDLTSPTGGICPDTNALRIEQNMWYRAWSGTQWTSNEGWVSMGKYNQDDSCVVTTQSLVGHCYGGKPVPYPTTIDTYDPLENVLTNQGTLGVEFKIHYPTPCIGTYNQGTLSIIGKAI